MSEPIPGDPGQDCRRRWRSQLSPPSPKALACLALCFTAAWAASHLRVPLAWVLGPLLVTALFAMADVGVFAPLVGRRAGQLVIGASVGLNLTGPVLLDLFAWLPVMVASAFVAIATAAALSVAFARATRLDRATAFFTMMPGGLSEMANTGLLQGARPEPIALGQALRVALIVCLLPPLLILSGDVVDRGAFASRPVVPLPSLPLILLAGVAGAYLLRRIGFQNPWMVGSLVGVATLSSLGLAAGRLPLPLVDAGQFFLGIAIGARFKGDIVRHLARLSLVSIAFTVLLTTLLGAYALLVARALGVDFAVMMLSTAPGGFAEMVLTAQTLHVQVTVVTAFHIVRSIVINGCTLHIWTLLNRVGFLAGLERALNEMANLVSRSRR